MLNLKAVICYPCCNHHWKCNKGIKCAQRKVLNYTLEAVQGSGRRHSGHGGSIHCAELNARDVEGYGGRLQPRLYHLQGTCQNGSHRTTTPKQGQRERQKYNLLDLF